jgi:hypothetical protein
MSGLQNAIDFMNAYLDLTLDQGNKPIVDSATNQWVSKRKPNPRDVLNALIKHYDLESNDFRGHSIVADDKALYKEISFSDWQSLILQLGDHYSLGLAVKKSGGSPNITQSELNIYNLKQKTATNYGQLLDNLKELYGEPSLNPFVKIGLIACILGGGYYFTMRALKKRQA